MSDRKKALFTDFALIVVFAIVFAVSFYPETSVPIYGGQVSSVVYNGNREKPNVSIMINVYENTEIVNSMMDVFDGYGVKATFFVGGCWADDNEATLKRMAQSGYEIGNHGYFHKDHATISYDKNKDEIVNAGKIVEALAGVKPDLFAPPSGSYSDSTIKAAFDNGYRVIMWSKDTIDWRDKDENKVYSRATENAENGDLVLMHPKAHTLAALPRIIERYKEAGFNVVTVSENLA